MQPARWKLLQDNTLRKVRPLRSLSAAAVFVVAAVVLAAVGCTGGGDPGQPDLVWGKQGLLDGEFEKPRAMAIDADDRRS